MTMWIYWQSEHELWSVGYYSPDGERHTESDHESPESAAAQVHYLNGGEKEPELPLSRGAGGKWE